jgi:RanBP1 domain
MSGKRTNDEIDQSGNDVEALKKQRDGRLSTMKTLFAEKMRERDMIGAYGGLLEDCNCFLGYYKAIEKPVNDALARQTASTQVQPAAQATPHVAAANPPAPKAMFSFSATAEKNLTSNPTTTGVSFSFSSGTPAPGLPPTPAPASAASVDIDDDAVPSEPRVEVEHVSDPDWTTVHDVGKVKFYVFVDGNWSQRASGTLRVDQSNSKASSRRIVIRDANTGKVHLNCSIVKDMPIMAQIVKQKYYIKFVSRQIEDDDDTRYMLQTNHRDHEKLVETLKEMAR